MEGVTGGLTEEFSGLVRRGGRLFVERDGQEPVAVTIRYLRPLTARREIVLLDPKGGEVATLRGLEAIAEPERTWAQEALADRYLFPVILRVHRVEVRFGTRYWWATTDRGPRWFALREPGKNVSWITPTRLVLRDTAGNRFEIPDLAAMDPRSRRWVGISL
jgi:hypothetical protein